MKENRSGEYISVLAIFGPVCLIAVTLRCYCRIFLIKSFGLDDYFAVLAMGLFMIFTSFAASGIEYGTGRNFSLIPTADFPVAMKWWWACEPTYVLVGMALKQSIVIFLLRIAVHRIQRLILYITITVAQIYSAYFLFLFIFQCWPISNFWNQYRGGTGHCINPQIIVSSFYAYSAVSCAADWIFSIVPIFMVYNLQMDKKTKISVGIMLAFAAVASTATIVRIPYISGLNDTANFLYATIDVAIWSTVETGLGIATSCVATLRPLLKKFTSTIHGSSSQGPSSGWGRPSNYHVSGYHRKHSRLGDGDIRMRDDLQKGVGVTTTVTLGGKKGKLDSPQAQDLSRTGSVTALKDPNGWNGSNEHKLNDGDSDDYVPYAHTDFEVRKVVRITQE